MLCCPLCALYCCCCCCCCCCCFPPLLCFALFMLRNKTMNAMQNVTRSTVGRLSVLRRTGGGSGGAAAAVAASCAGRRGYHDNIVEHYENPRNVGSLDKGDKFVGTVRACVTGDGGVLHCFIFIPGIRLLSYFSLEPGSLMPREGVQGGTRYDPICSMGALPCCISWVKGNFW